MRASGYVKYAPDSTLPRALAKHRLVEAPMGAARYVARSDEEAVHATMEWWNLLDAKMAEDQPLYGYQTGYLREIQLRRMIQLVRQRNVRTYCEVGMNGGHSSTAMLLANPNVTAHVFDLLAFNYSRPVAKLLRTRFGDRFELHAGWSTSQLHEWHKSLVQQRSSLGNTFMYCHARAPTSAKGSKGSASRATDGPQGAMACPVCDMVLVDGDHSDHGAYADIVALRSLTVPNALVVVDDIAVGPGKALARATATGGMMELVEEYGPYPAPHEHNPCMRMLTGEACERAVRATATSEKDLGRLDRCRRNKSYKCITWGFAIARYVQ